jgi:hypothetical protein
MQTAINALTIVVALGIFNVWLLRFGRSTRWRGGEAKNMREEFAVYGLPAWFMYLVGFFKLALAVLLVATIWFPSVRGLAGGGLAALMAGAVAMHVKVRDPALKSAPALCMLAMSLALALTQ